MSNTKIGKLLSKIGSLNTKFEDHMNTSYITHSTTINGFKAILESGDIKSDVGLISTTRKLSYAYDAVTPLPIILVINKDKVATKFKIEPVIDIKHTDRLSKNLRQRKEGHVAEELIKTKSLDLSYVDLVLFPDYTKDYDSKNDGTRESLILGDFKWIDDMDEYEEFMRTTPDTFKEYMDQYIYKLSNKYSLKVVLCPLDNYPNSTNYMKGASDDPDMYFEFIESAKLSRFIKNNLK